MEKGPKDRGILWRRNRHRPAELKANEYMVLLMRYRKSVRVVFQAVVGRAGERESWALNVY